MKFSELVDQVGEFLRQRERVSYRALKREFGLDDDSVEDVKAELIDAQRVATDEDGKALVWVGASPVPSPQFQVSSSPQPPILQTSNSELRALPPDLPPVAYTPAHLAERIRAAVFTEGERKTITALFADLKGSTALIESLDPEEARALLEELS